MPVARLFLFLCLLLRTSHASEIALIGTGENWRYLKGVAEPQTFNKLSWFAPGYDDLGWLTGRSGFSTPGGYGEVTLFFDYGSTYRTVYFRKEFTVQNPSNIAELVLRLDYDDGFVAYLNGQEVARRGLGGLPNTPVPFDATATYHFRGPGEQIPLPSAPPLLQQGTNIFAVQLLGSGGFDRSASFVPELLANVIRGPYVQNTTSSSAQIIWKTLSPATSALEFGTNINNFQRMEVAQIATQHVATVTALLPDTEYFYRVVNRFAEHETLSDWQAFRTFKRTGPVTFHVVGDSGWGSSAQLVIAEQMGRSPADFLMHVGDLVYYSITHHNADLRLFSVYRNEMRSRPWFLALGNHEMYTDPLAALQCFFLPTNSVTGTEHYYSFDHGDAHFVVAWSDVAVGSDYKPGSPQYEWLEADLARTIKPWKFLFFHHTWRTSSAHQVDDYDANQVRDSEQLDAGLANLARKHGVQVIFNGHDHTYERLAPSGGPISFISGGGGASAYSMTTPHPDSSQFFPAHHFLRVSVQAEETLVEAVGLDGNVFDKVHVRRTFPARALRHSTWHTPNVETSPATDADGNITGQRFDFVGQPVNGPMGLFSSAGRLFVNNDGTNIYFGFDEVMLRAGEELFFFLDVPSIAGRTNLQQIGNGIVDPQAEGVDGLDFMSNLAFENFSPSIGVVLGDEWGDAESRSFLRAGQSIKTGQGAFYLAESLPPVPAQRLTQFNRSPQIFPVFHEQNADFVKLSIPFHALGSLQPGDAIRVGAITALRSIDTNGAAQLRHIDKGGIGYSVREQNGITFLEGFEVKLATGPDADGDGLSDDEEFALGTNPKDPDSDHDALPDAWEVQHSFDPLVANGAADADQDGFTNEMEFRAGTNPRDPASLLALQATEISGGRLRLSWSSVPGKRYQIQYRESLAEPFRDLEDPLFPTLAEGSLESHWIKVSDAAAISRYFRVLLVE